MDLRKKIRKQMLLYLIISIFSWIFGVIFLIYDIDLIVSIFSKKYVSEQFIAITDSSDIWYVVVTYGIVHTGLTVAILVVAILSFMLALIKARQYQIGKTEDKEYLEYKS